MFLSWSQKIPLLAYVASGGMAVLRLAILRLRRSCAGRAGRSGHKKQGFVAMQQLKTPLQAF
jgi:hypothetical protein